MYQHSIYAQAVALSPNHQSRTTLLANTLETVQCYIGQFPDEANGLNALQEQLCAGPEILVRSNMRGHLTSSLVVLDIAKTSVLVIHHKAYDRWIQPGGHYEAPGDLYDSACREVWEETGLKQLRRFDSPVLAGLPLDIDTHAIPARPSKNEGAHWHHDFAYLAIASVEFMPVPQVEEVFGVKWMPLVEFTTLEDSRIQRIGRKIQKVLAA